MRLWPRMMSVAWSSDQCILQFGAQGCCVEKLAVLKRVSEARAEHVEKIAVMSRTSLKNLRPPQNRSREIGCEMCAPQRNFWDRLFVWRKQGPVGAHSVSVFVLFEHDYTFGVCIVLWHPCAKNIARFATSVNQLSGEFSGELAPGKNQVSGTSGEFGKSTRGCQARLVCSWSFVFSLLTFDHIVTKRSRHLAPTHWRETRVGSSEALCLPAPLPHLRSESPSSFPFLEESCWLVACDLVARIEKLWREKTSMS